MSYPEKSRQPHGVIFIRIAVGLISFKQGILKYTDRKTAVPRFTRIGFPHPWFMEHFVRTFQIVCGFLLLFGLLARFAVIPLLVIVCMAIVTTKLPELTRAGQRFWFMVSDARTDFAMLMCSLSCCSIR